MLYGRYKNESDFRTSFVRPLLTRLGFVSVAELHGQQEYGKDFVFSEITPFGFLRHYGAVVKHKKSITQSSRSVCDEILAQVRQAFAISFRLPDTEAEHPIASVVVFTSGRISDNARIWLRSELSEERYGRNVHILDGERLFQLDLSSTFRQTEQFLPRLRGIHNDINLNLVVWQSILKNLPKFSEGRGCFTTALEGFLAAPFFAEEIEPNDIAVLVQECRIIDRINSRYMAPYARKASDRDHEIETLKNVIKRASQKASRILQSVNRSLKRFQLLTDAATE